MDPYVFQPYPSWRYSRAGEAKLVNDPGEDLDLKNSGGEWADTPAAFEAAEPAADAPPDPADEPAPADEGSDPGPETDSAAAAEDAAQPKPAKKPRK